MPGLLSTRRIFFPGDLFHGRDRPGKNIGIIIRCLSPAITRTSLSRPMPVSTCLAGKGFQAAVFQTVELHKYIIPDLDHLRMVVIHQCLRRAADCVLHPGGNPHGSPYRGHRDRYRPFPRNYLSYCPVRSCLRRSIFSILHRLPYRGEASLFHRLQIRLHITGPLEGRILPSAAPSSRRWLLF